MAKLKYIGPQVGPFQELNAYGRNVRPDTWTEEEQTFWFGIEPRFKSLFEQEKQSVQTSATDKAEKK